MRSYPHSSLPGIYRAAQLFCLTSWINESFPVVYLEALASNLPVIATDDPIRRETIGPAGLFVDPHDISKFSQTITQALNTNWGDLPRQQSLRFDYATVIQHYVSLFKSI